MFSYLVLLILFVTIVIQSAMFPLFGLNHVHPDLIAVVILAWGFLRPFEEIIVWILIAGLLLDSLTTAPFGVFTLSLMVMAFWANFWYDRLPTRSLVLPVLLCLPYSLLFNGIAMALLALNGYTILWQTVLAQVIFPAALMNVAAMVIIFPLLQWAEQLNYRRKLTIE